MTSIASVSPVQLGTALPEIIPAQKEQAAEASCQFEAILLRQFLSESMKPLLEQGPSGQVYGYLMVDSLAAAMSDSGGLGLSTVLQAQLTNDN